MISTSPRLVSWENGTDLVIEMALPTDPTAVWEKLTDGAGAGTWFAPFTVSPAAEDSASEDSEAEDAAGLDPEAAAENPTIVFDLGETELEGEILSCEQADHALVELDDFGVLGIRLIAIRATPEGLVIADDPLATDQGPLLTLLVFTQTASDLDSARLLAADHGPMWDTHLRLFARSLGFDVAEADEESLTALYSELEVAEASDEDEQ